MNAKDLVFTGNETIYLTYLLDTNTHPWENGNGSIYVTKGIVNGSLIEWDRPVLVNNLGSALNYSSKPQASFPMVDVGGIAFTRWNSSTKINEIMLAATSSDLADANFSEIVIQSTSDNIEYVHALAINRSIMVSWVENHSRICSREVQVNGSLSPQSWTLRDIIMVYDDMALSYAQPVFSDDTRYYVLQMEEGFIPMVIEQLANGSWRNLRQIALEGPFAVGQIDAALSGDESQMIYVRDTPLTKWQMGHWKFDEGNGTDTVDSSDQGNDATISGDVHWVKHAGENLSIEGAYWYYLGFTDPEDYVQVPHDDSLNVAHEFTATSWILLNNFTQSPGTPLLGKMSRLKSVSIMDPWRLSSGVKPKRPFFRISHH